MPNCWPSTLHQQPDLDLYHPWLLSVEAGVELARRCEQAAFAVSPQISNSEGATVSIQEGQFVSANSLGFMGGYPSSRHYLSCSVIAGKNESMQRDDWYSTLRAIRWRSAQPSRLASRRRGEPCRDSARARSRPARCR
jgi:predicted Zn-dependent protease